MKFALVSFCTLGQFLLHTSELDASEPYASEFISNQVKHLAEPYIEAQEVEGLSIGVIRGNEQATIHLGNARTNNAGQIEAPDDNTIYEIGSISKVFTGLLLADLVVRDQVKLEDAAQSLLPQKVVMPIKKDRAITLLDLTTHRSGLPRLPSNMPSTIPSNPYADYTSDLAHTFLNGHKLKRAPGVMYEYSNFAVSLLGHMLSSRAGTTYQDLLKDRIAKPLAMMETTIDLSESAKSRLATPHMAFGTNSNTWEFADMPGAGGIRSTATDMLKFAKANIAPPPGELGDAIELAWKVQAKGKFGEPTMCLGWHLAGDGSTRWHNGQTGGYHSMLMINRENKTAVIVLSNTATKEIDQLGGDLMKLLAGRSIEPRVFEKSIVVPRESMERYVGKFQLAPQFEFTVSIDDGKLMVGLTGQPTLQVFAKSETEWFYKVVDAKLRFILDESGKCNELELHQNGLVQKAPRTK